MGFKLTDTVFSTGADEALAAVDAFKVQNAKVINLLPELKQALDTDALTGLKGGNLGEGVAFLSKTATAGLKVNSDALIKGVLSSNSGLIGVLRSLPATLQAGITSAKEISKIVATVNGVKHLITNADLSTLQGVSKLISGVAGAPFPITFLDKTGLTELSTNLVREASRLGIPDAYGAFISGMDDKTILRALTKNLLPTVLGTSNLNLLSSIAATPLGQDVTKLMPSFARDFTKQFVLPPGTPAKSHADILNKIDVSLTQINGAWKTSPFGGGVDMTALSGCSRDMGALMDAKRSGTAIVVDATAAASLNTSVIDSPLVVASSLKAMGAGAAGLFAPVGESLAKAFPWAVNPKMLA